MKYAIVNIHSAAVVQGPWGALPGRICWPSGNTVSPPAVGMEDEAYRFVEVLDYDLAPSVYHGQTEMTQVLKGNVLTVSRRFALARAPDVEEVKEEARRRILALAPDWKQVNLTARAIELQEIRRVHGTWTDAEQEELSVILGVWSQIKAIRTRSDEIEAMDPIPIDFRNSSYWAF